MESLRLIDTGKPEPTASEILIQVPFGGHRLCDASRLEVQQYRLNKLKQGFAWETTSHLRHLLSKLDDHFKGDKKDQLEVFRADRRAIEEGARKKYLAGAIEPDGSVLIRTLDVAR